MVKKIEVKTKKIILLISILSIAAGQFIFLFSVQSKVIWRFDGVFSGSSPWGGEFNLHVPPNPLASNKYVIKVSESFAYVGQYEQGNITFIHLASLQSFFFEYSLGDGPFIGTESESVMWILPSGMYNVIWNNGDAHPHYKLIAVSFFYPVDQIVILISGFLALFCAIGIIRVLIGALRSRNIYPKSNMNLKSISLVYLLITKSVVSAGLE